jgi:hypothetical protein
MAEQVAAAISIFTGVAQRITAVNKVAKMLEISEEQLNAMVIRAAKQTKKDQDGKQPPSAANAVDEARKLLSSQHQTAVLLCQMALKDAEVMYWLRETDCEDLLREVPGTELLALLVHSRYNPLDETSQLAFMTGMERHQEAAFALLQTRPHRPEALEPSGLEDAKKALYTFELSRVQNLILGLQAKQRQPGLSAAESDQLTKSVMELIARRKECLDRTKPTPNSFSP